MTTMHVLIGGQTAIEVPFYDDERWIQFTARTLDEEMSMLRERGPVIVYVREPDGVCRIIARQP